VVLANAATMQGDAAGAESLMAKITDPVAKQAALTSRYNAEIMSSRPVTRQKP
jgi:predicted alpha/beta-hydrolase family hydrolase